MALVQVAQAVGKIGSRLLKKREWVEEVAYPIGGLICSQDPADIPNETCTDVENVYFLNGAARTRWGMADFGGNLPLAAGNDILAAFTFTTSDGTEYIMALATNKVYVYNTGTGNWDDKTALLVPAASQTSPWSYDVMNDLLIMAAYGSDIYKYDGGAAIVALGGADGNYKAALVAQFANHLLLFNVDETGAGGGAGPEPFRVRWSIVDDPETWAGAGSGTFDLISGDDISPIVGVQTMGDHFYVFKKNSIFRGIATGVATDAFHFEPVVRGLRGIIQRSIQRIGDVIYFMTTDGVYVYGDSGESMVRKISEPLEGREWESISQANILTSFASVNWRDDHYKLHCPVNAETEPSGCFVYDFLKSTWSKEKHNLAILCSGWAESQSALTIDDLTTGTIDTLGGHTIDSMGRTGELLQLYGDTSGNVFIEDPGLYRDASSGDAYDSWFTTKDFRYPRIGGFTHFAEFRIRVSGASTFYVDYSTSGDGGAWTSLGSILLDSKDKQYVFHINKTARRMRFRLRKIEVFHNAFFHVHEYAVKMRKGPEW